MRARITRTLLAPLGGAETVLRPAKGFVKTYLTVRVTQRLTCVFGLLVLGLAACGPSDDNGANPTVVTAEDSGWPRQFAAFDGTWKLDDYVEMKQANENRKSK
jgi:hypothetical protein